MTVPAEEGSLKFDLVLDSTVELSNLSFDSSLRALLLHPQHLRWNFLRHRFDLINAHAVK